MAQPIHALQPAFTGGEISDDVASRVDLDKYQLALLNAENAIIRPYGSVKKRTGSQYCGTTKNNGVAILHKFEFANELSYLLEFGVGYLRIWRQGTYLGVELSTPFTASDLPNIRTVQSIDVMYICTGTHPVYKLARYSEQNWQLNVTDWKLVPFMDEPTTENAIMPLGENGSIEVYADDEIFTANSVGDYIKMEQRISGTAISASHNTASSRFTSQTFSLPRGTYTLAKTGSSGAKIQLQARMVNTSYSGTSYSWSAIKTVNGDTSEWTETGTCNPPTTESGGTKTSYAGQVRIVATSLDANELNLKITDKNGKQTEFNGIESTKNFTEAIRIGDQWKITTHGIWKGTVVLQISYDEGVTWTDIRTYTGNEDYNPTESGTVEEMAMVRAYSKITSGTVKIDLNSYAFVNTGYVKITGYTDAHTVQAEVIERCEPGLRTKKYYMSAWGKTNGYPYTATFFQDRLVLGGCPKYPQRLWMSRTGDYENFEVEKTSGTVTDDSAISADMLSQQPFRIQHIIAVNDLIILTEGNTWTISGSEVVTPSNISPRIQESHGSATVKPVHIGSRTVYVQRRGGAVRDVGYTYDTDSYAGVDLTLLAKHLVRGNKIIDGAFAQEPDSVIFFVQKNGTIICLTYIPEQKVYAWSHYKTDGSYEAVSVINELDDDRVYVIVKRTINGQTKRYIERFATEEYTDRQQDYRMMDSYKVWTSNAGSNVITGLNHLEGKTVSVIADNYYFDNEPYIVTNGQITLPESVHEAVVGLPYRLILEQPNIDIGNTETGTIQGRMKVVTSATLRVTRSYGGTIGPNAGSQAPIIIDRERLELGENVLFSGDKQVVLGTGGYNYGGRTYIIQDEPFPFNLTALIREVNFSDL